MGKTEYFEVPPKKSPDSALLKSRVQRILRSLLSGGVSYAEGADPHKGDPEYMRPEEKEE